MGKKAVRVSGELWQQICTIGWACGDGLSRDGLICTEGLPEGAIFHSAFYIPSVYSGTHILTFVFEHPDWPELEPGQEIPMIEVVWKETYDDLGL